METLQIMNILLSYFAAFGNKDIKKASENFSENVVLSDWNGSWWTMEHVVETIQGIFDSVDSITICPTKIALTEERMGKYLATCIIDIHVSGKVLKVVDLISLERSMKHGKTGLFDSYNEDWKITSITAYKQ